METTLAGRTLAYMRASTRISQRQILFPGHLVLHNFGRCYTTAFIYIISTRLFTLHTHFLDPGISLAPGKFHFYGTSCLLVIIHMAIWMNRKWPLKTKRGVLGHDPVRIKFDPCNREISCPREVRIGGGAFQSFCNSLPTSQDLHFLRRPFRCTDRMFHIKCVGFLPTWQNYT